MDAAEASSFHFEKTTTLRIDCDNPGILTVRPSESLVISRCTGKGRLLASVTETSSHQVVVEDAVCFDSDAYAFLGEDTVQIDHTVIQGASSCVLVELHVERTESLVVDFKQTFQFIDAERRR